MIRKSAPSSEAPYGGFPIHIRIAAPLVATQAVTLTLATKVTFVSLEIEPIAEVRSKRTPHLKSVEKMTDREPGVARVS
jgi:hypothetical protein